MEELSVLECRYAVLATQLQAHRANYFSLQEQYASLPDVAIPKLEMVSAVLKLTKSEILEVSSQIKALKKLLSEKKSKRGWLDFLKTTA
jgi:hypothetical protein